MLDNQYETKISANYQNFEFISEGPNGLITKVVHYSETNLKGYYNLGFGDKDTLTGFVSDISVSNNGDMNKVLSTVATTLFIFIRKYPEATVIATGSTDVRTRLYRIGISNNLEKIEKEFVIMGLKDGKWEIFQKNIDYGAFLAYKK
ncbi:MAG: hypothetical protein RLZZ175_962 [Bacteroidota bacterium]|jgi:hypothetical protein